MSYDVDFAVIGGGAAGLTAAGLAANAGAKTVLIERGRLGGDCTWTGCIPSKALLKSAHVVETIRTASNFGLKVGTPTVDFQAVMDRVHAVREAVYEDADRPEIYEGFGIEVIHGGARFVDARTLEITPPEDLVLDAESGWSERHRVTGRRFLTFRMALIGTGGRAAPPLVDGLNETPHLTNESLFEITEQPNHLAVLGGGPVGAEMGQAFARLGSRVTVLDMASRILSRDDADHADQLREALEEEGVSFRLGAEVQRVEPQGEGVRLHLSGATSLDADALLVATGRRPNIESLHLEAAGVEATERGITVDDRCRTSQAHIYAAGDCTGEFQLTHISEHMARTAATNAVLKVPSSIDREGVPWVTFTDPELAHLGKGEAELKKEGARYEVYRFPYAMLDRALAESSEGTGVRGEVKVFATAWTGAILGASVLGERAGELMQTLAVARKGGVSLREVADTIFAYPTFGAGVRRAADQWYVRKQYPQAISVLKRAFGYRGETPPPPDPDRIV